jgi:hypothetical protein
MDVYDKSKDKVIALNKNSLQYHSIMRACQNNKEKIDQAIRLNRTFGLVGSNIKAWLDSKKINYLNIDPVINFIPEMLEIIKSKTKQDPSTGFAVAHYYSTTYKNSTIYLVNFGFKGSPAHNWKAERYWCSKQRNIKLI